MPVPKSYEKKYGTIVAAQTSRLEKKGKSKGTANSMAKAMADKAMKDAMSKRKKGKKK